MCRQAREHVRRASVAREWPRAPVETPAGRRLDEASTRSGYGAILLTGQALLGDTEPDGGYVHAHARNRALRRLPLRSRGGRAARPGGVRSRRGERRDVGGHPRARVRRCRRPRASGRRPTRLACSAPSSPASAAFATRAASPCASAARLTGALLEPGRSRSRSRRRHGRARGARGARRAPRRQHRRSACTRAATASVSRFSSSSWPEASPQAA